MPDFISVLLLGLFRADSEFGSFWLLSDENGPSRLHYSRKSYRSIETYDGAQIYFDNSCLRFRYRDNLMLIGAADSIGVNTFILEMHKCKRQMCDLADKAGRMRMNDNENTCCIHNNENSLVCIWLYHGHSCEAFPALSHGDYVAEKTIVL